MTNITYESPSVQSYLNILQSIINRMAANSSGCKTWCITLVSAIILIIADKSKPAYLFISIVPIILFLFLDSYYLGLERLFRNLYNEFIKKLHSNIATIDDVFMVSPGTKTEILRAAFHSFSSIAVWPFYGLLGLMLYIVHKIIL
ncbi:MAG: hypothetical protein AYP45_16070 [Candidatus Brocadia carolinensis]|uniref:Uncharacterized protein n=1 Tax=Candidatus Brocadia carolinensis TaxID=1004156 RepID=A0A1V4AQ03_9BACT|nr:MAG: hypothetical protein AYP45_16070 [Candidatus Brocadia caroliniensis]